MPAITPLFSGPTKRLEKVTIVYKSGAKVRVKCRDFTVKRYASGGLEVSWDGLKPAALLVGVDEIAAVWNGWV